MEKIQNIQESFARRIGGAMANLSVLLPALVVLVWVDGFGTLEQIAMLLAEVITASYIAVQYLAPESLRKGAERGMDESLTLRYAAITAKTAKSAYARVRRTHRAAFEGGEFSQVGSVGRDVRRVVRRATGRQGGASVARRQASGAKSAAGDDGDGGDGSDGEPPHQYYTYVSAAQLLDCSPKTLRNKVAAGLIAAPTHTAVGPRFTRAQLQALIDPPLPTPRKAAPKRRGRPRIAIQRDGGVSK